MGFFPDGIATCSDRADGFASACPRKSRNFNVLQMGVVVQPPFWAKHEDDVAANVNLSSKDHQAAGGGKDTGSFFRKNIHAFVGDGSAPRVVPEGIGVVILVGGTFDGHGESLGEEEAKEEDGC